MKNIFIIANTSHILHLDEAYAKFECKNSENYLIVYGNYKKLNAQLNQAVKKDRWNKIFFFYKKTDFFLEELKFCPYKVLRFLAWKILSFYQKIIWEKRYKNFIDQYIANGPFDYLFVINLFTDDQYIKKLTNDISYKSLVMIDDGTSTISIVNKIKRHYQQNKKNRNLCIDKVMLPDSMCFFSSLPINVPRVNDIVVKNEFSFLKSKIINPSHFNKYIYFLGAPLYDTYFSFEEYLFLLERVKQYFIATELKLYYIPHRAETENKLKRIANIFQIRQFDKPIELVLVEQTDYRPAIMASFFSSGLVNSAIIFSENDNIKFYSFYLSSLNKRQGLIDDVYKSFIDLALPNFMIINDY